MNKLSTRDIAELFVFSAIWGASFLFLRIAAPVFGPVFLIEIRVLTAFVFLLPIFLYLGKLKDVLLNWKMIFLISLANMALPFTLLAFTSLSLNAGFTSILNATVPFFTAIIALLFFSQYLSLLSITGLFVGFGGVVVLVFDPASTTPVAANYLAIGAGLLASLLYGAAANLTTQKLSGVSGLAITVGSLFFATIYLLPFALWQRPEIMPQGSIWLSVIALGVFCTGLAYVMFYRLIARIGPYRAVTVTFLIPLFSILWGAVFLEEQVTLFMALGCFLVLVGVSMTTGRLPIIAILSRGSDRGGVAASGKPGVSGDN